MAGSPSARWLGMPGDAAPLDPLPASAAVKKIVVEIDPYSDRDRLRVA